MPAASNIQYLGACGCHDSTTLDCCVAYSFVGRDGGGIEGGTLEAYELLCNM